MLPTAVVALLVVLGLVHGLELQRDAPYEWEEWMDTSLPAPFSTHPLHHEAVRVEPDTTPRRLRSAELAPLFPGYGTHYAYAYVGTPPQRQSLIVDTGSHYTAFPCTGCSQCGTHTDLYFHPANSSTLVTPKCLNNQLCLISQSYTEGSSWHGYKIKDQLWIGGAGNTLLPGAEQYSIPFVFGCQTSSTGLFRTQLADGILGMSASEDTLPVSLFRNNVTTSKVFALCYRIGGGIMTIGGVDQRIHTKKTISYAALSSRANGLYGVTVTAIALATSTKQVPVIGTLGVVAENKETRILEEAKKSKWVPKYPNKNKDKDKDGNLLPGVPDPVISKATAAAPAPPTVPLDGIVDSGTTDSYLPRALLAPFQAAFKEITNGMAFVEGTITLTNEQLSLLPDIIFELASPPSTNPSQERTMQLRIPFTAYLDTLASPDTPKQGNGKAIPEPVAGNKYTYRIYFTESSSIVLGANVMSNTNVIFDTDNRRIGFVKSLCNYEEFAPVIPVDKPSKPSGPCVETYVPYTQCSARCDRNESGYTVTGKQDYISTCADSSSSSRSGSPTIVTRTCTESCSFGRVVRGDVRCPDTPWAECSHACFTSRKAVPSTEEPLVNGKCSYQVQTQPCYAGLCPRSDGDYLLYIDMRVRIEPVRWSYVYTEAFFQAFADLFKIKGNAMELLNNAGLGQASEYNPSTKLHFQIRLKASNYKTPLLLHAAAEKIITTFRDKAAFAPMLIDTLAHLRTDSAAASRFGWLFPQDVEVLSAVALPIGDVRDPYAEADAADTDDASSGRTLHEMLLIGVACGALLVLLLVLYMHYRLRQEYALLSKDKSTLSKSTEALRKLWTKFAAMAGAEGQQQQLSLEEQASLVEMHNRELEGQHRGLMQEGDEEEEEDEEQG